MIYCVPMCIVCPRCISLAVPDEIMKTVKILYVSNLPPDAPESSEAMLFSLFERFGTVERVKRMKNFAFVHFKARQHAEAALAAMNNSVIDGHAIKIQWSKPPPKVREYAYWKDAVVVAAARFDRYTRR